MSTFLGEPIDDPTTGDIVLVDETPGIHVGYCLWFFKPPVAEGQSGLCRSAVVDIDAAWRL